MSLATPISAPTYPLHPAPPSPSRPHYSVATSLHSCAPLQKRVPFFSTACALFLIRNSVYPSCFVEPAHSLPKTPRGTPGLSNQIPTVSLTPIESKRSARIAPNPCRMKTFHATPGGWGPIATPIEDPLEQTSIPAAPSVTPIAAISFKITPSNPFRIYLFRKHVRGGLREISRSGLPRHPRASNVVTQSPAHTEPQPMQIGIDSFAAAISDPATGLT